MRNLFLLSAVVFFLVGCRDIKEVHCTGVKGFKVNHINTSGIDGDILLGIKNPNNFGFSIYKSAFDVTYSGIYLGKARLTRRVFIRKNAEETYSFNLKSDFKNVNLMDVMKLLQGATSKGSIEVKGDLKVGKLLLRKSVPVDVKEKIRLE
jgi:LEA14-like dessication related protein